MISHEELGKRVAAEQNELVNEGNRSERDLDLARKNLFSPSAIEMRDRDSSPRRVWVYATSTALAAAALIALIVGAGWFERFSGSPDSGEEIALAPGTWYSSTDSDSKPLRFVDGSRIVLGQASGMRVIDTTKKGSRVLLEYGKAVIDVVHRENTKWLVEVGPFSIHVTGTSFSVVWNPQEKEFNLNMKEGSIELDGPIVGEKRRVNAGENVRIWLQQERMELVAGGQTRVVPATAHPIPEKPSAADKGTEALAEAPKPPKPVIKEEMGPEPPTQSWQDLANDGRFGDIYEDAQKIGMEKVLMEASASELMVLGDTARLLGKWNSADKAYHSIRRRFPDSPVASTAAFALGKMAFDRQHLYDKASKWLSLYLSEQSGGPLAQEALGRLMEAKELTGDLEGAAAMAKRYLVAYPNGPYAPKANDLITSGNGSEPLE